MSMHGGGSAPARMGMRGMTRSRDLLEHRIKKGTLPRILKFARAYKTALIVFITAVILDAVVSSVSPLLLRQIIDIIINRKTGSHHEGLVVGLALLTAGLALFDAILALFERRISAVIGESLIFDLRAKVFQHIQDRCADQPSQQRRHRRPASLHRPLLQCRG